MATEEQVPIDQVAEVQEIDNQEIGNQETNIADIEDETLDPSEEALDAPHPDDPPSGEGLFDELSDEALPSGEEHPPPPEPAADNQSEQSNQDEQQTAPPRINGLEELPVELLFVVDQFKITLKEVEQIKPNYVFELNNKTVGQVEIRANGATVGCGELVQIEDRAGVRVIELYNKSQHS